MKLLTKAEYEKLNNAALPVAEYAADDLDWQQTDETGEEIYEALIGQGRARRVTVSGPNLITDTFEITPAGREALKLWPMLVERGLVQP